MIASTSEGAVVQWDWYCSVRVRIWHPADRVLPFGSAV